MTGVPPRVFSSHVYYPKVDALAPSPSSKNQKCSVDEPAVDVAVDMVPNFCRQAKKR
jgi:hypothetical protein